MPHSVSRLFSRGIVVTFFGAVGALPSSPVRADSLFTSISGNLSAGASNSGAYSVAPFQIFSIPDSGSVSKSGNSGTSRETVDIETDSFSADYDLTRSKTANASLGGGGAVYFTPSENLTYQLSGSVSLDETNSGNNPSTYFTLAVYNDQNYDTLYSVSKTVTAHDYSLTLGPTTPGATGSLTGALLAGVQYEWDPDIIVTDSSTKPTMGTGTAAFEITFSPAVAAPLPGAAKMTGAMLLGLGALFGWKRRAVRTNA